VDEESMKKLSKIITIFCLERSNLDLFINELKGTIIRMSEKLNKNLEISLSKLTKIERELQKRTEDNKPLDKESEEKFKESISAVINSEAMLLALFDLETQLEDESKIHRVFKIISQLYELSYKRSIQGECL
jgi:predicted RNase H-like nuclease (RuvC/YqgF family)